MRARRTWIQAVGLAVLVCARTPAVASAEQGQAGGITQLDQWVAAHPMPADENIVAEELGRTDRSSMQVVRIRGAEPLHHHHQHDLFVLLYHGRGTLRMGGQTVTMTEGSAVTIPIDMPHAFTNQGGQPAVLFIVFTPVPAGEDYVLEQTKTE